MTDRRRYDGRRFYDDEKPLAHHLILDAKTSVEVTDDLDCSLEFLFRQFGEQSDRVIVIH